MRNPINWRSPWRAGWFLLVFLLVPMAEAAEERTLLVSSHARLTFDDEIQRVAVANSDIVKYRALSSKEGVVLALSPGRTTLSVWFTNGQVRDYVFRVQRDLSVLEEALRRIDPSITVEAAPDRDAVILLGVVPELSHSEAAEALAKQYVQAGRGRRAASASVQIVEPGGPPAGPAGDPDTRRVSPMDERSRPTGTVINLIRLRNLPGRLEDRIRDAIASVAGPEVTVRRIVRGRLPDDAADIFVLEGTVPNQVALTRTLTLAASTVVGKEQGADRIRVVADESGAVGRLESGGGGDSQVGVVSGLAQSSAGLGNSSGRGRGLANRVGRNVARAKILEAGEGRVISLLHVRDVPQVRVDTRLYEVNCTRLRAFDANFATLFSDFDQPSLNPARAAGGTGGVQGAQAARVGSGGTEVQNVLSFLGGQASNQFQFSGGPVAIDAVLTLLEARGLARSLSRPSLTVLSGEPAFFQVGGEVPVPQAFATAAASGGVLNSVVFRSFGIQLSVRPLVGRGGDITVDVIPEISLPDAQLTAAIRQTTGTRQSTASFETRTLRTTARLKDGQALLVGGLLSKNKSANDNSTPGLRDLPGAGPLFRGWDRSRDEIQLIVMVHPVIVREPTTRSQVWAFPSARETLRGLGK
ncbi:MAG: pilus assembly protein N-terminal domain-containing protein [Planctomycetota bacterium]|nr:pilus assembly protein N-terminal domain-containing protein [Planctomycetota bacterium]